MTIKTVLTAATVAASFAMLAAPTAHADQYDFVSYLDNHGVYYSSVTNAIDTGKLICRIGRSNLSDQAMLHEMVVVSMDSGFTTAKDGAPVLEAGVNGLCRDIQPRVEAMFAGIPDPGPVA